jgi:hypothetical protein
VITRHSFRNILPAEYYCHIRATGENQDEQEKVNECLNIIKKEMTASVV